MCTCYTCMCLDDCMLKDKCILFRCMCIYTHTHYSTSVYCTSMCLYAYITGQNNQCTYKWLHWQTTWRVYTVLFMCYLYNTTRQSRCDPFHPKFVGIKFTQFYFRFFFKTTFHFLIYIVRYFFYKGQCHWSTVLFLSTFNQILNKPALSEYTKIEGNKLKKMHKLKNV